MCISRVLKVLGGMALLYGCYQGFLAYLQPEHVLAWSALWSFCR
jgi:hypothetical protein